MQKIKSFLATNGRNLVVDLLLVVAMVLVAVGAGLIYMPAGLIVGGVLLGALAVLLALGAPDDGGGAA